MRSCLIVDENASERRTLADAVRSAGKGVLDLHEAENADAARKMLDAHAPDIVFLDMTLAGNDPYAPPERPAQGLGVLQAILAARPGLPVVVVTGAGAQPDVVDAISMGAIAALRRPVKAEDVKFILDAIDPERARMDYFG